MKYKGGRTNTLTHGRLDNVKTMLPTLVGGKRHKTKTWALHHCWWSQKMQVTNNLQVTGILKNYSCCTKLSNDIWEKLQFLSGNTVGDKTQKLWKYNETYCEYYLIISINCPENTKMLCNLQVQYDMYTCTCVTTCVHMNP